MNRFSFWLLGGLLGLNLPALAADPAPVQVKAGQTFTLSLASNPTTGYQWRLARPLEEKSLLLLTNQYLKASSRLEGAAGKQLWKFRALRAGQTEVHLEYVRAWETQASPAQVTNVQVVISR